MSTLSRRGFFTGLISALAAPAIIKTPGLLMPVRALIPGPPLALPWDDDIARQVVWQHWQRFNTVTFATDKFADFRFVARVAA